MKLSQSLSQSLRLVKEQTNITHSTNYLKEKLWEYAIGAMISAIAWVDKR